MIPFDAQAMAVLDRATAQAGHAQAETPAIAQDEKPREPQLHQKTVFIARPGAIAALVHQPGWENALGQAIRAQSQETTKLAEGNGSVQRADGAPPRGADSLLQRTNVAERSRAQTDQLLLLARDAKPRSARADARRRGDGDRFRFSSVRRIGRSIYLMARTTWIEREADIERLVPAPHGLLGGGRPIRFAM